MQKAPAPKTGEKRELILKHALEAFALKGFNGSSTRNIAKAAGANLGLIPYYTSARFALEAVSEALYHEVKRVGIAVVIMQPVAMRTNRAATGAHLRFVEGVVPIHRAIG